MRGKGPPSAFNTLNPPTSFNDRAFPPNPLPEREKTPSNSQTCLALESRPYNRLNSGVMLDSSQCRIATVRTMPKRDLPA